jgi:hypothetical protein
MSRPIRTRPTASWTRWWPPSANSGREGDRYVFKGDNNDFLDPTHPDRSQLVGKLWLRAPRAGVVLASVRQPLVSGALLGGVALLLLGAVGSQRRWRRRTTVAPPEVSPAPAQRPAPVPAVIGGMHLPPRARSPANRSTATSRRR